MASPIRFEPAVTYSYNHAIGDYRKPSAYRVFFNGEEIGQVYSTSEESWRTLDNGIRYSKRGYSRHWVSVFPDGSEWRWNYTREQAVQKLIERKELIEYITCPDCGLMHLASIGPCGKDS